MIQRSRQKLDCSGRVCNFSCNGSVLQCDDIEGHPPPDMFLVGEAGEKSDLNVIAPQRDKKNALFCPDLLW